MQVTDAGLVIKPKMSDRECGSSVGGREPGEDTVPGLRQLMGKAVLRAMVEDWTVESLERYLRTGQGLPVRELPDDSISEGSVLQIRLMRQLAGFPYPLEDLSRVVRDFFALAVSGTRVLEDETISYRVVWASRGAVADPVFVLRGNLLVERSALRCMPLDKNRGTPHVYGVPRLFQCVSWSGLRGWSNVLICPCHSFRTEPRRRAWPLFRRREGAAACS